MKKILYGNYDKRSIEKYQLRGRSLTQKELYNAAGIFISDDNIDFAFNIEKDVWFRKPEEVCKHLSLIHTPVSGMTGPNDYSDEYLKVPNKCHVPLYLLDPPIARLVKIFGQKGFKTVYSCADNTNLGENSSIVSFSHNNDLNNAYELVSKFESPILCFNKKSSLSSWMGTYLSISRKDKSFIVDDDYFWEIQRLCDFLLI